MKITLKQSQVIEALTAAYYRAGSTEWAVYATQEGEIDLRHNTQQNSGWIKVLSCYGLDMVFESDDITERDIDAAVQMTLEYADSWVAEEYETEYTFEIVA